MPNEGNEAYMLTGEEAVQKLWNALNAAPDTKKIGSEWLRSKEKRDWDLYICRESRPLFAPLILSASATILWWDRKAPIFSQERIGMYGIPFNMHKLRSMNTARGMDASQGENDPRVIPPGTIMRARLIDELPQWRNIKQGQMSWSGHRPLVESEIFDGGQAYHHDDRPLTMQYVLGRKEFNKWFRGAYITARPGMSSPFKSRLFKHGTEEFMIERKRANCWYAENATPDLDRKLLLKLFERSLSVSGVAA
ncbi:sugar transferase [Actinomadura sp. B10D3]|uniref:sugar transferase n=1 Tax=Actinomadura sp. B10D3 TaxID=3153557 RepID=UPI00325EF290